MTTAEAYDPGCGRPSIQAIVLLVSASCCQLVCCMLMFARWVLPLTACASPPCYVLTAVPSILRCYCHFPACTKFRNSVGRIQQVENCACWPAVHYSMSARSSTSSGFGGGGGAGAAAAGACLGGFRKSSASSGTMKSPLSASSSVMRPMRLSTTWRQKGVPAACALPGMGP